jgi:hypothetical protein
MLHFWLESHDARDSICTEGFARSIWFRKSSTHDLSTDKGLHRYHVVFLAGSEQRVHLFISARYDGRDGVEQ